MTKGKLPSGLTLSSAGEITGTATASGTFTFTVTATDSSQPTPLLASAKLSLQVVPTLVVTTTSLPGVEVGATYSGATLATTGGTAPISWEITGGSLPAGLYIDAQTGAVLGTATLSAVSSTFTVTAMDSSNPFQTASAQLSITVTGTPLTISPTSIAAGTAYQNQPYSYQFQATGGTAPYTWSVSKGSALPPGLSLNPTTGVLSGTPNVPGGYGLYEASITVTDADNQKATINQSIFVETLRPLYVLEIPAEFLVPGEPFSTAVQVAGGLAPYTFSVTSGSLPPGIALNSSTGVISGTPLASDTGNYSATVTVTDSQSPSRSGQTFADFVYEGGAGGTGGCGNGGCGG